VSLNTLEFTIPGDVLNGGAPNEITAAVVAEAFTLALYGTGPGNEALRTVTEGSRRGRTLVNEVNTLVNEMHQFDRQESVRGWANVAVIAELLARKTERMGRALGENSLMGVSQTMRKLGNKASIVTDALKEGRNVPNLGPRFNQAMRYVVSGAGLVACIAYPLVYLWLYHERFTTGRPSGRSQRGAAEEELEEVASR